MTSLKNKYLNFSLATLGFSAWVLWMGAWWLFAGIIVLFDIFITKKVPWRFWKLPSYKESKVGKFFKWSFFILLTYFITWFISTFFIEAFHIPSPSMEQTLLRGDYIIVSKVHYGPRLPRYPLSLPFLHNRIPFTNIKSYSEKIELPFHRLKGFSNIHHGDVVVFNFPEGDTTVVPFEGQGYYSLVRKWGKQHVHEKYTFLHFPVDKREHFIKRCVGLPGDILSLRNGEILINNKKINEATTIKHKYFIKVKDSIDMDSLLKAKFYFSLDECGKFEKDKDIYELSLTESHAIQLKHEEGITGFMKYENTNIHLSSDKIFPHHVDYAWTEDNFGPIYIPSKGHTILLKKENLPLYKRIIEVYEKNTLIVKGDTILINGHPSTE
ncbi:MAG: signal peptidase I, partial [Bacteroidota bacterium]